MPAPKGPTATARAIAAHRDRWGEPRIVARAPGRVNLIGEHTDHNDGFTLPMALPYDTVVALSTDGDERDGLVTVTSEGFGQVEIDPRGDPSDVAPWALHLAGVVAILRDQGIPSGGWRAAIATDVPTGASLSSSAALEVATITALATRAGRALPPIEVARLGQRVENEVVGLASGIMDQFISAGAVAGHASLMDCRALTLTPIALPDDVTVAVLDTGTRRVLADVAYDDRRDACRRAAADLGIAALRDATPDQVESLTDEVVRRRARHVVTENARTLAAADALRRGDVALLGQLMDESHASLRDDYEVSGPGLDAIVAVAKGAPGCLGARMTGGGFAGCAVALVESTQIEAFSRSVVERYDHQDLTATVWPCPPGAGASVEVS